MIKNQIVSSRSLSALYKVDYPTNFSGWCDKDKEAVLKQCAFMMDKIQKGTGIKIPLTAGQGFRIKKDNLGIGSKYDVDVIGKERKKEGEVHSFPEELHGDPPVIFVSKEQTMDVLKRLIRYAAQTILARGQWGGCFCKEEVRAILRP
jgi:hypothetical protein